MIPTGTTYRGVEELPRAGANSIAAIGDQPLTIGDVTLIPARVRRAGATS